VNREILRLAVPNIISNLTVPLLGVVDTALMGHAPNKAHLGAIAVGSMIFNFLYWGFGFLRMGTTGLTAQAYGQDDHATVISLLSRAVLTALVASLLLILLQMPIVEAAFWLVESSAEVEAFGRNYFGIRIYAAPATIALYAFYGWFMGMQNSRYVLIVSLAANLTNVVANVA
jgi:MATE family multidrug resistance protein